jgi:hypothetical protein
MHAYHDPKADRVDNMCVQTSSCVPEYLPKLAERACLGSYIDQKSSGGRFVYENGEIRVKRVTERECT